MAKGNSILGDIGKLYERFAFQSPIAHFGGKAIIPDEKKRQEIYGGLAAGTGAALAGGAALGGATPATTASTSAIAPVTEVAPVAETGFDWTKVASNVMDSGTKQLNQQAEQPTMTPLQKRQQLMRSQVYQGG